MKNPIKHLEDPIKSHDGMDIDSHSAVTESTGYEFKQAVAADVIAAFEQDIKNNQATLPERLYSFPVIRGAETLSEKTCGHIR